MYQYHTVLYIHDCRNRSEQPLEVWIQVSPRHAQALISMLHAEIGKAWLTYVCVVCSGCGSERTWTSKYATVYSIPIST